MRVKWAEFPFAWVSDELKKIGVPACWLASIEVTEALDSAVYFVGGECACDLATGLSAIIRHAGHSDHASSLALSELLGNLILRACEEKPIGKASVYTLYQGLRRSPGWPIAAEERTAPSGVGWQVAGGPVSIEPALDRALNAGVNRNALRSVEVAPAIVALGSRFGLDNLPNMVEVAAVLHSRAFSRIMAADLDHLESELFANLLDRFGGGSRRVWMRMSYQGRAWPLYRAALAQTMRSMAGPGAVGGAA